MVVPRPDSGFEIDLATTDELVQLAAAGSVDAFARLVRLRGEAAVRVAWLVTGNMQAAADAARAAWVIAWTGIRKPHDPVTFEPWLARLAAVEAVRVVRQAVNQVSVPGSPAWSGESAAGLAGLEPADRAIVALHHLSGIEPADLDRLERYPAGTTADRLPELWRAIGADAATAQSVVERMADVPLRPIDADGIARLARAEEGEERIRILSVVIGTAAGIFVMLFPLLADIVFHR